MAKRELNKLSATTVEKFTELNGRLHDGGGLFFETGPSGSKNWMLRYTYGRRQFISVGTYPTISLKEARERAIIIRKLVSDGIDPKRKREQERAARASEAARSIKFQAAAATYIDAQKPGWKNAKHASQWINTLTAHAFPKIGAVPVADVDTDQVLAVLEPIWRQLPETASRLRSRIERVLDWCTIKGYRTGANPARWRGHLEHLLPRPSSIRPVKHHPSLDYRELPDFMAELQLGNGDAVDALKLLILTTTRTSEVIQANVLEVDLADKLWVIPGVRMKSAREHQVPLVKEAIAILKMRSAGKGENDAIFPGYRQKHLSSGAMDRLLERMGRKQITVHGFRSTFRDWAGDNGYSRELAEVQLAHKFGDEVERSYRRSTDVEGRRDMLTKWAAFAFSKSRGIHR